MLKKLFLLLAFCLPLHSLDTNSSSKFLLRTAIFYSLFKVQSSFSDWIAERTLPTNNTEGYTFWAHGCMISDLTALSLASGLIYLCKKNPNPGWYAGAAISGLDAIVKFKYRMDKLKKKGGR